MCPMEMGNPLANQLVDRKFMEKISMSFTSAALSGTPFQILIRIVCVVVVIIITMYLLQTGRIQQIQAM